MGHAIQKRLAYGVKEFTRFVDAMGWLQDLLAANAAGHPRAKSVNTISGRRYRVWLS